MPAPEVTLAPSRAFTVTHQKVSLEVDFASKSLKGYTEITISPFDQFLKHIKLDCRQCNITNVLVNDKDATNQYTDPYTRLTMHKTANVHQHHMLRDKMAKMLSDPAEEELTIMIPRSVKIEPIDLSANGAHGDITTRHLSESRRDSPDVLGGGGTPAPGVTADTSGFTKLILKIEYRIDGIQDGFHFVGCDPDDLRFPHAYTTGSPYPGSACCLFPCVNELSMKYTWDLEFIIPRTIGDIPRQKPTPNGVASANGVQENTEEVNFEDAETNDRDLYVVATGDFHDAMAHPLDPSRKIVKYSQATQTSPHHIGFAVGPFQRTNLSEFRDSDDDDAMGSIAVDVIAFSLPGREDEVKNTCIFLHKAVDFIVKDFSMFPFTTYKLCFVDDLPTSTAEFASLSLCSNHLLVPTDVIDPLYVNNRKITYTLAAQWWGVHITPKQTADMWILIGAAYYVTGLFLKKLMGNNEYRFRLKKDAQKICELDINRPSLFSQGLRVPLEPNELDFMILKAPVVLFILERRLTKATGSLVLHRVLRRMMLAAVTSTTQAAYELSTAYFIRQCEKLSHTKLDSFFAQWVFGSGYPRFEVSQRFNKKKLVIEMGIKQVQATDNPGRALSPDDFMMEARANRQGIPIVPVYSGPMTIRIHEADGTPYEHVVNITEGYTKLDIPYNTKYKRLKRTRRQKERAAAAAGLDISADNQADDVLLYCLGDVLQSEEEIHDWRIEEWSKEEEEKMSQESFEWIRMDADFEWICTVLLNQPDYMFLSQLQQDRDVVAQYEAIEHFSSIRESPLVSSILVRTLIDRRYYYGIRVEAAMALAKCARAELDWIGEFHLRKSFQEFYCLPGSSLPRSNDFSDYAAYIVQKSIPIAMSRIRNNFGTSPISVQKFLLDLLRYNDNSNNMFSDCHYVSALMTALSQTLINEQEPDESLMNFEFEDHEIEDLKKNALREIERHQRMDQFLPSYQNAISKTALDIKRNLAHLKVVKPNLQELLAYTREANFDKLRIKAFDCLVDLGALRVPPLLSYILYVIGSDPSPYIRRSVLKIFTRGLGAIVLCRDKAAPHEKVKSSDEMLIIEDEASSNNARKANLARGTISGAMAALREELKNDETLKEALWKTICSPQLGILELRNLLDVCRILYDEKTSHIVMLKLPKELTCKHLGKGVMQFKWDVKTLKKKPSPISLPPVPFHKPITTPTAPVKIKLKTNATAAATPPPSAFYQNNHNATTPNTTFSPKQRKLRISAAERKAQAAAVAAQQTPPGPLTPSHSTPTPKLHLTLKTASLQQRKGSMQSIKSEEMNLMSPGPHGQGVSAGSPPGTVPGTPTGQGPKKITLKFKNPMAGVGKTGG